MKLEDYGRPLAYETAFWSLGLKDPAYPLDDLGELSLKLSASFRSIAIMVLLVKGDSDRFYHNLIRSALSRHIYLQRLQERGIENHYHNASGRFDAFVDAVAANDFELGAGIARLSPREWLAGREYRDDYYYAQILHRLAQPSWADDRMGQLLDQFEQYGGGEANPRLKLCRALVAGDGEAFENAFTDFLLDRDATIAANKERGELEEPGVIAGRLVSVEGLAILRLAGNRGIPTQQEYQFCPSLARIPMQTPFPGE